MWRGAVIFLLAILMAGCRGGGIKDYWHVHSIDYSDIQAAEDQFALFAEEAVAAPEAEAMASLDVLFNKLKKDEVAYYLYTGWIDGAFYNLLSPCRNAPLYGKAVERMAADGILSGEDCERYRQKSRWIRFNREGDAATVPGDILDSRRTLVLVLDPGCPSCREALTTLAANPAWTEVRRVAVFCGPATPPDIPGWEYFFPEEAPDVFDPHLTPVYFVVSAEGTVEIPYTLAL